MTQETRGSFNKYKAYEKAANVMCQSIERFESWSYQVDDKLDGRRAHTAIRKDVGKNGIFLISILSYGSLYDTEGVCGESWRS